MRIDRTEKVLEARIAAEMTGRLTASADDGCVVAPTPFGDLNSRHFGDPKNDDRASTVDLALVVNGLSVVTFKVKNDLN